MAAFERLSINLITLAGHPFTEALDAVARRRIPCVSVWRHHLEETGVERARQLLADRQLRVSSICRGGFFPAVTEAARQQRIDDNRRAIDEAAALEAEVLVLVCGAAEGSSLAEARAQIREGIAAIAPYARDAGVRLGIEPLHPMLCSARSAITTLAEASDIVQALGDDNIGVVVDTYHVWWDPQVQAQIARAGTSIVGFHVSDWVTPNGDALASRAMMGDGCIELRALHANVDAAGYRGPIEVEVINPRISSQALEDLLPLVEERYAAV